MISEALTIYKTSQRHWHHLLQHKKKIVRLVDSRQILYSQLFTVVVSIAGGILIDHNKLLILSFGGALLLYPAIIDLSASLAGALGAKLNHHLEKHSFRTIDILISDISFSILLTITSSIIIGALACAVGSFFLEIDITKLFLLSLLTSIVISLTLYPLIALLVLLLRQLGLNADNIIGPVESSMVDILATFIFIVTISVLT